MLRNSLLAVALTVLLATGANAIPSQITVQGRLTDAGGVPLPAGPKTFTFRIFNANAGGLQIWPGGGGEIQSITSGADGLWIGLLGAIDPLSDLVFADSVRWLEIDVDGTTLPRIRLVTGPYAYRVATVDGASGGGITSKVTIGTTNTNTGNDGFVAGADNQATANYTTIPGGVLNVASGESSVIAGGQQNDATGFAASVGGGASNTASNSYAAIGGGLGNTASNLNASVGGGQYNASSGVSSTVSGGALNSATSDAASVGGGSHNYARGQYSTVAGGGGPADSDSNSASGFTSQVGGGRSNVASGEGSGVDGGYYNIASGIYSTVGGGRFNFAQGSFSTVAGGGGLNIFNDRNEAAGYGNVIGGGSRNWTRENFSTISGGQYNVANGQYTTVGGGFQCQAAGPNSTVSGGYQNGAGENGTVGGGYQNAADLEATVSGGRDNYAYAFGTIGGGHGNRASYAATVAGGYFNKATGQHSTIAGGGGYNEVDSNSASGAYSFVGGGSRNYSSGAGSVTGGGDSNRAKGQNSVAGGGGFNVAAGGWSTVPGGNGNEANGDFSFAAGSFAHANHPGTFVWGDRSFLDSVYSTNENQFIIRASGGVGIGTVSPQQQLSVAEGLNIDQSNFNSGALAIGLSFGSGSGEGIASKRTAGGNQYGLDFYTNNINRMSIANATGYVGFGLTNPGFRIDLPNIANADGQGRANAWVTYSSRRWKENITPIRNALQKVEGLRGVEYDNKSDGSHSIGLIAEEVGKVIPEVVQYESNSADAASLDYARLVALLIEGMKEQQKQIDELKSKVSELAPLSPTMAQPD